MFATPEYMRNPEDARQETHRYGAVWGEMRGGEDGYYKYYESNLDDVETFVEYTTLTEKEQVVKNAKGWARNNYPDLDQQDLCQEIDIKAWLLEESGEVDYETNDWVRPKYVMTALKNAVHDYARKEIGFRKSSVVKEEVFVPEAFAGPGENVNLTFKTAKAAILLFVTEPTSLSLALTEQVKEMIDLMTDAELQAIAKYLASSNHTQRVASDRAIKRVMKILGYSLKPKEAIPAKNHEVKEDDGEAVAFDLIVKNLEKPENKASEFSTHTITLGKEKSPSESGSEHGNGPSSTMITRPTREDFMDANGNVDYPALRKAMRLYEEQNPEPEFVMAYDDSKELDW